MKYGLKRRGECLQATLTQKSPHSPQWSGLGNYNAAWATLNPLRADALTPDTVINPAELVRSYNTAADAHIARREWLLLDFDPKRPTGTNSTDTEKAAAWQQAEQCRDELTAMGWPVPMVLDSGNGYHLRYQISLPNDAASHELVRSALHSLARRYSMLDVTNHNAARVAKLPGTAARKGEHTAERPHRVSALLLEGEGTLTEAQLRAVAGDVTTVEYAAPQEVTSDEAKAAREWLLGYIDHFELVERTEARRITGGWKIGIYCPLTEADSAPHDEGMGKQAPCCESSMATYLSNAPRHLRKGKRGIRLCSNRKWRGATPSRICPNLDRTRRSCWEQEQHGGHGHSPHFCKQTWALTFCGKTMTSCS